MSPREAGGAGGQVNPRPSTFPTNLRHNPRDAATLHPLFTPLQVQFPTETSIFTTTYLSSPRTPTGDHARLAREAGKLRRTEGPEFPRVTHAGPMMAAPQPAKTASPTSAPRSSPASPPSPATGEENVPPRPTS